MYYATFSHLDSLGLGSLSALIVRDERGMSRLLPA